MKLTLLVTGDFALLLIYAISAFIAWVILYYTIKVAVRNGIIEAKRETGTSKVISKPEKIHTSEHNKLKDRYDKGQISFEEYTTEWAKLESNR